MVKFGNKDIRECIMLGFEAEKAIEKVLKPPMFCMFEKIFDRFCLVNKKRYAGHKLSIDVKKVRANPDITLIYEVTTSGLETVRRENCNHMKTTLQSAIDAMMNMSVSMSEAIQKTKDLIVESAAELMTGHVSLGDLLHSSSCKGDDSKVRSPATEVVAKMKRRDVSTAPRAGDRVAYTFVKNVNPKAKAYECAEHPTYALDNSLPLDYERIFQKKFAPAMVRFMRVVMMDNSLVIPSDDKERNAFFKKVDKEIFNELFCGLSDAISKRVTIHQPLKRIQGSLGTWAKPVHTCLVRKCGAVIDVPGVCASCHDMVATIRELHISNLDKVETLCEASWDMCKACDNYNLGGKKCHNITCTNRYKRVDLLQQVKNSYRICEDAGWL